MKDKPSQSDDEMDDETSFQLELTQEDRDLEEKAMEVSDQTLCEAADQTERSAAVMAASAAMTSRGQGEGHMPPPPSPTERHTTSSTGVSPTSGGQPWRIYSRIWWANHQYGT